MNKKEMVEHVGKIIINNVLTNSAETMGIDASRKLMKYTEQSPMKAFEFAQELCDYLESRLRHYGYGTDTVTQACFQGLGFIIILLGSRVSAEAVQRYIKDGDSDNIEKIIRGTIEDFNGLEDNDTEPHPELDKATKDSLFDGLDFGMKWKDDLN